MTALDLTIPFGLGRVTSLHCVQMCGPIVLAFRLRSSAPREAARLISAITPAALTYSAPRSAGRRGGRRHRHARAPGGIERTLRIVAGAAMIVAGISCSAGAQLQALVQIGGSAESSRFAWPPATAALAAREQ